MLFAWLVDSGKTRWLQFSWGEHDLNILCDQWTLFACFKGNRAAGKRLGNPWGGELSWGRMASTGGFHFFLHNFIFLVNSNFVTPTPPPNGNVLAQFCKPEVKTTKMVISRPTRRGHEQWTFFMHTLHTFYRIQRKCCGGKIASIQHWQRSSKCLDPVLRKITRDKTRKKKANSN